jgi:REP element-mobilizing transposase RayT
MTAHSIIRATMSYYRRARTGSTYFFTLVSFERRPILCLAPVRNVLRLALQNVRAKRPFDIDAWVLMPDHLHCIWTLPEGDSDYSTRWAQIKRTVSRFCDADIRARSTFHRYVRAAILPGDWGGTAEAGKMHLE